MTIRGPVVIAIISALVTWWVWGEANPIPRIQDESAYVLQARIFATGHWTAPAPPMPEFFQQPHVLTSPRVASKFPPGHSLLLTPGALLGMPAVMVLVLTALFAALLFVLVQRATGTVWIAWFTWLIWLSDPINLRFRPGFYSEVTSALMCLVALWGLLRWRETAGRSWLLLVAAAIGWGAITRPLSMLAFAAPIGVVVLRDVWRRAAWADLALASGVGIAVLAVLPFWSARTTGAWRTWPITQWRRDYLPYDKPGFGLDTTPPARVLSVVNKETYYSFRSVHTSHTLANLPRTAIERLWFIARAEWSGVRVLLVPFVVLGLMNLGAAGGFALVCAGALFAGYLAYGHYPDWTLYYFEAIPALSLVAAIGVWRVVQRVTHVRAAPAVAACFAALAAYEAVRWRPIHQRTADFMPAFYTQLTRIPVERGIVFVRYAPRLRNHVTIVANSPDLANERFWIVHDRGDAENRALLAAAPGRVPLLLDEATTTLQPYPGLTAR